MLTQPGIIHRPLDTYCSPVHLPWVHHISWREKGLNVATGYQGNKIDISTYNNLNSFLNHLNLSFSASTSINTDTIKNNLSLYDSRKKQTNKTKIHAKDWKMSRYSVRLPLHSTLSGVNNQSPPQGIKL